METKAEEPLLKTVSDTEFESLDCPTLETQKKCWDEIVLSVSTENLNDLLEPLNYTLIDFKYYDESKGLVNKIFLLTVINKKSKRKCELILRLRNPIIYANDNITESEVGIMTFLKQQTNIPIPNIISYSLSHDNPLKCCYILMEKVNGKLLRHMIDENPNIDIPDSFLNEIIEVIKTLQLLNLHPKRTIGHFDLNMNIVPIKPYLTPANSFLDYYNQNLLYAIKEMKKISKYTALASRLDECREELVEKVTSSPKSNNLNYNDRLVIIHGDLNSKNIFVDPDTWKLVGIIDWEWSRYDFNDKTWDFMGYWMSGRNFDLKAFIDDKNKSQSSWYKKPTGRYERRYLWKILSHAQKITNYSLLNYNGDLVNQKRQLIEDIEYRATELSKMLECDSWKSFLRRIR